MKKLFFTLTIVSVLILSACQEQNNNETTQEDTTNSKEAITYYTVTSDLVEITEDQEYTVTLEAADNWGFSVDNDQDVTKWLVLETQVEALDNQENVAHIESITADSATIIIKIDASQITGFTTNGGADLYLLPELNSMVGVGDNHAQYNASAEKIGNYVIPEVTVDGQIEGEVTQEEGLIFTENEMMFHLNIDGQDLDTSLIDNKTTSISLEEGDGYYTSDYTFSDQGLADEMEDASISYSIQPEDLQITNSGYTLGQEGGGRNWSEIGGDGNGNYNLNFAFAGLEYNGLPVTAAPFNVYIYCYGRTFEIKNGSIYTNDIASWSTTAEKDLPVLCDNYADSLTITWGNSIDASELTVEDLTLTMNSQYGDVLTLEPEEDFTIDTTKNQTIIYVNYTYWAYTPVYQTLTVDVAKEHLTWNQEMYQVDEISYTYDIASVYVYNVMAGGQTGTQTWTIYGLDNLENWQQVFNAPTYTLSAEIEGTIQFYSEENCGTLVDEDSATAYDASEDTNLQLLDNTVYLTRQYNQTEIKIVNNQQITFDKVYSRAELAIKDPKDCTEIEVKPGFILGDTWEEHLRWPWQTFINEGYQGGRS